MKREIYDFLKENKDRFWTSGEVSEAMGMSKKKVSTTLSRVYYDYGGIERLSHMNKSNQMYLYKYQE